MEIIETIGALPQLTRDVIHIWGVHVPDMGKRVDSMQSLLSDTERAKAARFRLDADRKSSICARGALRILLSGYLGIKPNEVQFRYAENGKPSLVPQASRLSGGGAVSFNVSHSGDWVVLAFGRDRHIGVDIEKIKTDLDIEAIATRFFSEDEAALIHDADDKHTVFFQLWARKEAYVKARGSGLFRGLSHFSVPIEDGRLPDCGESDGWIFHRLESGSKYASAVVTDKALGNVPCYDFGGLKWAF